MEVLPRSALGGALARIRFHLAPLLVTTLAAALPVQAADSYQGAAVILQKIGAKAKPDAKAAAKSPLQQLDDDLKSFERTAPTLSPNQAAREWLALWERFWTLPADALRDPRAMRGNRLSTRKIVAALPPPAAWPAIATAVDARPAPKGKKALREGLLRLLAHQLDGDQAARARDVELLAGMVARSGDQDELGFSIQITELLSELKKMSGDSKGIVRQFEQQLTDAEANFGREGFFPGIPDLVKLTDADRAAPLLKRALVLNTEIQIEGEATLKLARQLALGMVADLKVPQWSLTHSLDATNLFEKMEGKFSRKDASAGNAAAPARRPAMGRDDYEYQQARFYYLLGLIAGNRTQEAVALASKMTGSSAESYLPSEALQALTDSGRSLELFNFFRELLAQKPELPFWDSAVTVAAQASQSDELVKLIRATLDRKNLAPRSRNEIRSHLYSALLANDQVEEGVKELRTLLASLNSNATKAGAQDEPDDATKDPTLPSGDFRMQRFERGNLTLALAQLGHLLKRDDWLDEGVKLARDYLAKDTPLRQEYERESTLPQLTKLLMEADRGPEAEAVLADELARLARNRQSGPMDYPGRPNQVGVLVELAKVYHRAGRHADVLALLDGADGWGIKDLADLQNYRGGMSLHFNEDNGMQLAVATAASLIDAQRNAEARKVVDALLDFHGGYDRGYEMLLKIAGDDALPRLDELFARDRYEERPLIWKGHLLRLAGKLDDAEKIIRQAITIDPSDGEEGRGDRMRVYAELADILAAKGDAKQAAFFRDVVKAIRLSEDADLIYQAGLLKRGIAMYQQSLTFFADAYCIQSRLAIHLSEMGRMDEAEAHYRKAYELMPDSFGRVESHCFGCERAFEGKRAQSIADKVFTDLAVKTPDKPQVHYLLGILRDAQERPAEALTYYRKAVQLDPLYLNAWKKIQEVSRTARMPVNEIDSVVLTILKLDPLGRHDAPDISSVTDLKGLWAAVGAAVKLQPKRPASLYPLPASKAALEAKKTNLSQADEFMGMDELEMAGMRGENSLTSPALAIAGNAVIQRLINLLDQDFMRSVMGY